MGVSHQLRDINIEHSFSYMELATGPGNIYQVPVGLPFPQMISI